MIHPCLPITFPVDDRARDGRCVMRTPLTPHLVFPEEKMRCELRALHISYKLPNLH